MPRPIPPFYENWDNSHCVPCVLRAVLEHFEPDIRINWSDIDKFSGKKPGKWVWGYRSTINFHKRGYHMVNFAPKDNDFLKLYRQHGLFGALVHTYGQEGAEIQRKNSDMPSVEKDIREYIKLKESGQLDIPLKTPSIAALKSYIKKGYLVSCALNAAVLNGKTGYASHRVLVYDFTEKGPIFHDSGLPSMPARTVSWKKFVVASTLPTRNQWRMTAYKKV